MSGALVDSEGFPRGDVDIYAVRKARNRIICEYTLSGLKTPPRGCGLVK